jgi:hypothetical protein
MIRANVKFGFIMIAFEQLGHYRTWNSLAEAEFQNSRTVFIFKKLYKHF